MATEAAARTTNRRAWRYENRRVTAEEMDKAYEGMDRVEATGEWPSTNWQGRPSTFRGVFYLGENADIDDKGIIIGSIRETFCGSIRVDGEGKSTIIHMLVGKQFSQRDLTDVIAGLKELAIQEVFEDEETQTTNEEG